jgi:hypothetical protein
MVTLIRLMAMVTAEFIAALSGLAKAKRPRGDGGRRAWTIEEASDGDYIRTDDRCDDCCSLGEPCASRSN